MADTSREVISKQDKNELSVQREAFPSMVQPICQTIVGTTHKNPEASLEIHDYPPERNSKETSTLLEIDKSPE